MSTLTYSNVRAIAVSTGVIACLTQASCPANDWGYENAERGQPVKQRETDYSAVERAPREELPHRQSQTESHKQQAVEDWLQLYSFMSGDSLSNEQKVQFRKQLGQFNSLQQADLILSVLRFWPKVKLETTHNLDQVEGYRSLFKALLRMQLNYQPQSIAGSKDMAYEILGPSRTAVTGDPPLTEAAVNSYCDMACFLFEQKNPGRTMDVTENRAFFAKVIEDKFKNAPDATAKEAMSNFDLNWAEFKIIWAGATPAQRKELLKQWTEPGSNTVSMWAAGGISPSSTLSIVLKEGPWKELKGKIAGL